MKIWDIQILKDKFQYFLIDFYRPLVYDNIAKYGMLCCKNLCKCSSFQRII